ncbi:MAG: PKD domain-containing protein, partial [Actinomycetota bacterium]
TSTLIGLGGHRGPFGLRWPPRPINVEVEFENPEQITWLAVTVGDDTEIATLDNGVFTASLSPFELGDISFRYDAQRAPVEADDLVVGTDADFRSRIPTLAGLNILGVNTGTDGARVTIETPYGGEDMRIVNEIRFESGVDFTPTAQQLDEAARAGIPGYVEMVEIDELDDESGGSVAVEIYIPTDYLESLGITFDAFNDQPIAPIRAAQAIGPFSKILLSGEVFALASGAVNVQSFLSAITGGGKYDRINALRAAALECPTLDPNDREFILDSLALTRENALWLDGLSIAATIASFAVGIAFPVGGLALSLASSVIGELVGNSLESGLDAIKRLMEASDCNCPGDPSAAPRWIYDPAGYVFEGVESNRIEGATATVFEGVTETGPFTQWDAVPYAQINPQITGTDGRYAWDVPEGWWQVRYTKDGYLPNESEVLEVLPPHFDVNVGLVPVADPTVDDVAANAGPSGVDVTFSTYMDPTTVDIAVAGAPGSVVPLDEEPDPDGRPLARSYRFLPDEAFTVGDDVEVTVVSATDFAGRSIGDPFTTTVPVVAGESATLSGSVFSDLDLSVLRVDEPGIAGVEVIITDGYGQTSYATTDADGGFAVDVPLGPADVVIVATSAPLDGLATTAPSLAQRVVVGPDGGDATPVGFAPIAGAIDPLTVGDASGGTVEEGSTVDVTVDLTALPEPVVAGLDIDDDGVVDTPADALLRYDAANDDGPAQRTIDVIASDGRRVGTAPVQIEVVNVAPTVMPGTPSPTGLTVDGVIASYTDPGVADTHTAIIQWGDGTTSNGTASGGEVVGSHTYASAGSYDVEVCVGDDDGGVGCTELQVDVADEPTGSTMTPTTVPSPTSTPDATTPATTIPTSPSAGPPAVTDPPMPTMPNGGLPATGSSTGSWLLLALLAIAIGALAVLITRRRPPAPRIQ